ncbi:MAG: membrane protein insertase YidC [Bacteroidota bacterium]
MDRNTVIGFVLIGLLMMGMFYFNSRGQNEARMIEAQKKKTEDSLANLNKRPDSAVKIDSANSANIHKVQTTGVYQNSNNQPIVETTVENEVVKITFTNKGAQPKIVELKKYNRIDGTPVVLQNGDFNKLGYDIMTGENKKASTADLVFAPAVKSVNADKSQTIVFSLKDSTGKEITHTYTLRPDDYLVDLTIAGVDKAITKNSLNLNWQTETRQVEHSITFEKQQMEVSYFSDDEFDFERPASAGDIKFEKPVDWIAVKQQFFIAALINKNKFKTADVKWTVPDTATHLLAQTTSNFTVEVPANTGIPLQFYYGPSDYNILKKYNNQMQQIVPYGSGPFAFVKYINRHFLLPVFDFLRKNVASMGMVILLLTLLIRLLTSPILYKSYLSGAKMKALKPEVDLLKAKFTDKSGTLDQQAFSMEQMKLWKSAGVSPLGGCLPALLQIPIFMSLYYFFQSNISLRGESFLWAKDLAAYDSIYTFGNIPVLSTLYGDHISLFTITATITSLLISIYSMSNMQDNSNPVMKYMPYIFPVLMLGIFNNLPAALTWYYTISNTITLLLQIVIQKYIINHEQILVQIAENRKKPVKQSKLQERLQAMQESQKKLQEAKSKTQKK